MLNVIVADLTYETGTMRATKQGKGNAMKNLLIALGALTMIPAVTLAQEVQFGIINDPNSDGYYSYSEIQKNYPAATRQEVAQADRNNDGHVDASELLKAVASGAFTRG